MLSRLAYTPLCVRALSTTPKYAVTLKVKKASVKTAQEEIDGWLASNTIKGRPLSPHLSIYTWSIPMAMSAVNRIFAFGLTALFFAIPVVDFLTGDIAATISTTALTLRQTMAGTACLYVAKGAIIFPFFYHAILGLRHWSWDILALGIRNMGTFYATGYAAVAAALLFSAIFVLYHRE